MASGVEVATAYVNVVSATPKFSAPISKELGRVDRASRTTGQRIRSGLFGGLKVAAGVAAAGVAAVLGYSLKKGFERLTAIDSAEGKLRGLGHSGKTVAGIMDDVNASVKGTAFGLDEGATAAAGAVAAGIKPGKELTKYLSLTGDAATIAGTSLGEMGSIMNNVQSRGKAYTGDLNQLAQRGLPVFKWLQDEFGVTRDELDKMVKGGEVSAATFQKVIEENIGGAALEGGNTAVGAFANMQAAMGRFGVSFLQGLFPHLKEGMVELGGFFDNLGVKVAPVADKVGDFLGRVLVGLAKWLNSLNFDSWSEFVKSLTGGTGAMQDFKPALDAVRGAMPALADATQKFVAVLPQLATATGGLVGSGLKILSSVLGFIANNIDKVIKLLPLIAGGFLLWKAATSALLAAQYRLRIAEAAAAPLYLSNQILRMMNIRAEQQLALAKGGATAATVTNNAAENAGVLAKARSAVAMVAQRTATIAGTIATHAAAAAQYVFGAALRFAMGPIGWIITGITLLVAGLVWFFTQTKIGQAIVQVVWTAIKNAISAVVTWFTTVAWPAIQTAITALGNWFSWLYTTIILPVWNGIKTAIAAAWAFISPIFNFIVNFIKNSLMIYFQLLWVTVQIVWKSIQIAIQIAWNIIKVIFNAIVSFVRNVLAPIFTWFWNWVIKPVWSGIQLAIQLAWGAIKIIFAAIKWYIDNVLAPVFRWLWNNVIKPVWNGIKSTINTIWVFIRDKIFTPIKAFMENVLGPAFQWLYNNVIEPVWNNIKSSINTVWEFVRDKVFDPMKKAVSETVPDAFEAGKDAIAEAWNKIKDVAKKPVKFVIDTVINKGIIDNFNKIADIFDVDKIDHVSLPDGFARGGYTGAGSKYKPAGIVHADEFVVQKSSRRRFERDNPGALDHLNRTGRLPAYGGYASGGRVGGSLIDAANWWIAKGARGSRHPAFGGAVRSGHSNGSLHYQDRAVDLNYGPGGQNATEMSFFDRYVSEFKSLFPGIRTIWRAPGHYNHLHIDTSNGADIGDFSGASSGGGLLNILNPFQGLFDKIEEGISSNGMFGELIAGGAKKMVQAPIDWIKSKADWLVDIGENAVDAVGVGTTKARVKAVATARGWGFGQQWRDLSALIQQESSWNKNAANPTTSARGLFQKMTSIHGPLESTVEGQAGWGLNYIADRYGSPSAAWAFHKRNNWYAGGGHVTPTLYDKGGMLQPGTSLVANKTRKPEYILPARVTDALMDGRTGGNGITIDRLVIEAGSEADGRSLARDFLGEIRRQQRGGVYVGA